MFRKVTIIPILFYISLINSESLPESLVNQTIKITTLDGNILSGDVVSENENTIVLFTDFGTVSIDREKIQSLEMLSENDLSLDKKNLEIKNSNINLSINQEARWRTIYSTMFLGNVLYGGGIPYVLGLDDPKVINASQLLMFGGGFYGSYKYTQNMNLPYGRWQFQTTGAGLGGLSLLPLISTVGFENWFDFDEDFKLGLTYLMGMVPYGAMQADKKYNEWNLTNGQATLISSSVPWGYANAWGALFLLYGEEGWPEFDGIGFKFNFLTTYAVALRAPFFTKKYITSQSLTEDDALFTFLSLGLGFINSVHVLEILESSSLRLNTVLIMGITNGFGYLANSLIKDTDLKKGDWRIIGLGTSAAFLIRSGIGELIEEDFGDLYLILNMVALNAGWYFTFKKVSNKKTNLLKFKKKKNSTSLSLSPTILNVPNNPTPAMRLQVTFY